MYKGYLFIAEVKATGTNNLPDSLPSNDMVAELGCGEIKLAFCRDPEGTLPTPLSPH
jgi:hypothetical protein